MSEPHPDDAAEKDARVRDTIEEKKRPFVKQFDDIVDSARDVRQRLRDGDEDRCLPSPEGRNQVEIRRARS